MKKKGGPSTVKTYQLPETKLLKLSKKNSAHMKTRYDKDRRVVETLRMGQLVIVERKILGSGLTSGNLSSDTQGLTRRVNDIYSCP